MPETTITINREQRDGLYELIRNHLGSVGDLWHALEEDRDFAKAKQLGREFGEDIRLLTDLGWAEREQREYFKLTLPPLELIRALRRLQSEAGTILLGSDKSEEDAETVTTFRRGWKACEAVLNQINRTRPPAIKLSRDFRDTLYRLLCRREILYRESSSGLAAREGIDDQELRCRIEAERHLKESLADLQVFELVTQVDDLTPMLERLRAEARRAPSEPPHALEGNESDTERRNYYSGAAHICELLLEELGGQVDEEPA